MYDPGGGGGSGELGVSGTLGGEEEEEVASEKMGERGGGMSRRRGEMGGPILGVGGRSKEYLCRGVVALVDCCMV